MVFVRAFSIEKKNRKTMTELEHSPTGTPRPCSPSCACTHRSSPTKLGNFLCTGWPVSINCEAAWHLAPIGSHHFPCPLINILENDKENNKAEPFPRALYRYSKRVTIFMFELKFCHCFYQRCMVNFRLKTRVFLFV